MSEITFYGMAGERLGTWKLLSGQLTNLSTNLYFAGKLIRQKQINAYGGVEDAAVVTDRMGSVRMRTNSGTATPDPILQNTRLYPFGEELSPATANDRDKFATYYRDNSTGLDYAMNRYYGSTLGRFLTPDPFGGSAKMGNPQSWNRYSYVIGDPVNRTDPYGLDYDTGDSPFDPADPRNVGDTSVEVWDTVGGTPVDAAFLGWGSFYTASNTPPSRNFTVQSREQARFDAMLGKFLDDALAGAIKALFDPECAGLFRLPPGTSPIAFLNGLVKSGSLVFGDRGPAVRTGDSWRGVAATTIGVLPMANGNFSGARVTFNNNRQGAFVNYHGFLGLSNDQNRIVTVIHELGHAADRIYGHNASDIKDGQDPQVNEGNSKLAKDKCLK
ncbi:MAG: RHS repeat-associated core domain-containing protein [Acidobacteriota bacterium]